MSVKINRIKYLKNQKIHNKEILASFIYSSSIGLSTIPDFFEQQR